MRVRARQGAGEAAKMTVRDLAQAVQALRSGDDQDNVADRYGVPNQVLESAVEAVEDELRRLIA